MTIFRSSTHGGPFAPPHSRQQENCQRTCKVPHLYDDDELPWTLQLADHQLNLATSQQCHSTQISNHMVLLSSFLRWCTTYRIRHHNWLYTIRTCDVTTTAIGIDLGTTNWWVLQFMLSASQNRLTHYFRSTAASVSGKMTVSRLNNHFLHSLQRSWEFDKRWFSQGHNGGCLVAGMLIKYFLWSRKR